MTVEIYICIAVVLSLLICLLSYLYTRSSSKQQSTEVAPPVRQPAAPRRQDVPRNIRARVRNRRPQQDRRVEIAQQDSSAEDSDEELLQEEFDAPDDKMGAKKRKKLELKAEKKAAREAELQEREERKQRQERLEEDRKRKEEKQLLQEKKEEEEEKKRKEEEAKREQEAYEAMKAEFAVEEEGYDDNIDEENAEDQLAKFINFIKSSKVVILEDLASQFKLKTQDVIDRITALQQDGSLTGVIDDRGKFIYISMDELEAVAKFIRQRGRVSITELADASNSLINLNPDIKSSS